MCLQSHRQSNSIQALFPCFHMNLQASGHQPRDVARGANEEMIRIFPRHVHLFVHLKSVGVVYSLNGLDNVICVQYIPTQLVGTV